MTGDYAKTNTCPATLAASSSCTIRVTFLPTASGTHSGTLTIRDNAQSSPQTLNLSGVGSDFSLTSSPDSDTIPAGATASYALAVASVGSSFTSAVKLSCSGLPAQARCNFSPNTVTPDSNAATVTLTISTSESVAQALPAHASPNRQMFAVWIQLQGMGLFGMILTGSKSRSRKLRTLILLALVIAGLLFMSGCAGGTGIMSQTGSGKTPITYNITVTGNSGSLQHSIPLTLTIQ